MAVATMVESSVAMSRASIKPAMVAITALRGRSWNEVCLVVALLTFQRPRVRVGERPLDANRRSVIFVAVQLDSEFNAHQWQPHAPPQQPPPPEDEDPEDG